MSRFLIKPRSVRGYCSKCKRDTRQTTTEFTWLTRWVFTIASCGLYVLWWFIMDLFLKARYGSTCTRCNTFNGPMLQRGTRYGTEA